MKKLLLSLFLAIPFLATSPVKAQVCTPDTSYTSPGIYPANLPQACINQAYSFSVTVVVPQDTTVNVPPFGNVTIPIDSLNLIAVQNLPAGFSYQCNPGSCSFPGNGRGCVNLTGTPNLLGTYVLNVVADVWVTAPFVGSTSFRDTLVGVFTLTVGNPPVVSITGDTAVCAGGTAVLDAGAGFDAYLWSNGDTTQTITVTTGGSYGVKAFLGNCHDSTGVTLNQYAPPTVAVSIVDATCGQANGSATASPSGNSPFTYLWSDGQTTATASNLTAGAYTVTVTDANGCSTTQNATVNSVGGPVITQGSLANVSCAGANDGAVTVNITGGTSPYTYSWSNGATTQNLSGVGGGSYILTVTDASSCVSTFSVTINEPTALTTTLAAQINVSCNGGNNGSATLVAAGGTTPYQFLWNDGQNTATAVSLSAGRYQAIVTDANGCADTVTVNISEPAALSVSARADEPECNGDATGLIVANVAGGTPGYTYLWSTGATTAQIQNLPAGNYFCIVTDANGCSDTLRIPLNEPTAIVLQTGFTSTTPSKNDGKAWVTASGGVPPYTYAWDNGGSTDTLSNLAPGSYPVTVTDANGCEARDTVLVLDATGIDEDLAAGVADLKLFPNPTSGTFTLELQLGQPDEVRVSLFDASGRELSRKAATYTQNWQADFDLTGMPSGLYLLRVQTSKGATTRLVALASSR